MSGTSEAKKLPPTAKKLRDARKKGQSPRSADFVTAISTCASLGWLCLKAGSIEEQLHTTVQMVEKLQDQPFNIAVQQALGGVLELTITTVGPFLGIAVAAATLAGVLGNGGLNVSFEPLTPKLEKLDPIKGLKRIASKRSLIELGKTISKVLALGAIFLLTIVASWKALVYLPTCGIGCFDVVFTQIKLLIEMAAGALLIGGLADLQIQRILFLQEMRMTQTEAKREAKEQAGNPEVKHEHQRLRRETASEPSLGLHRATLILAGRSVLVGLRYVRGETGVPVLVCRGEGELASRLLDEARALRLAIVEDHALARQLIRDTRLGGGVTAQCFQGVARALHAAGQA